MKNATTTTATIAKPSLELQSLAILKAAKLQPHTQIRLTGAEHVHGYWVFNFAGILYIGREVNSPCRPFYNRPEMTMSEKDGTPLYHVQRLSTGR